MCLKLSNFHSFQVIYFLWFALFSVTIKAGIRNNTHHNLPLSVEGSTLDQDPVIPKTIKKTVPVVPGFSTQHEKGNIGSFSNSNNTIFEGHIED